MHKLATNSKHCSVKKLLIAVLEHTFEAARLGRLPLLLDSVLNLGHISGQLFIINTQGLRVFLDGPENVSGLVVPIVSDEPARRLGENHDTEEGYDGEEDLQSQGKTELTVVEDVGHPVVNPVGKHYAEDVDGEFDGETTTSILGFHKLGMPDSCLC